MFTHSRIAFVAGIALAASAFTLTAMADAPIIDETPAPVETVDPTPTPTPKVTPEPEPTVEDYPAYTADNPQECAEGYTHAEDYSCVPLTFWDDAPAPVVETPAPAYPTYTLPACQYEDSTNCYWDASARGNGQGASFVNLNGVYYYAE